MTPKSKIAACFSINTEHSRSPQSPFENQSNYYKRKYLTLCERLSTLGLGFLLEPKKKENRHGEILYSGAQEAGGRSGSVEGDVMSRGKSSKGVL